MSSNTTTATTTATSPSPSSSSLPQIQVLHLTHLPPTFTIHIAQYTNLRNAPHLHAQLLSSSSSPPAAPNDTKNTDPTTTTNHHPNHQQQNPPPPPPPPPYAFINPTFLLSPAHLHFAIFRACNDFQAHRLRTRSLHSEIVLSLGSTNNIAKTMGGVGLGREGREVVVVGVHVDGHGHGDGHGDGDGEGGDGDRGREKERGRGRWREEMEEWLRRNVDGESVVFGDEALKRVCDVQLVRRFYKIQSPSSSASSKSGGRAAPGINGGGSGGSGVKGPTGKEAKLERRRRRKEQEEEEEGEEREKGGERGADVVDGDGERTRRGGRAEGEGEKLEGMTVGAEIEARRDDDDDGGGVVKGDVEQKRNSDDEENERKELEMQVLGLMALRGAA